MALAIYSKTNNILPGYCDITGLSLVSFAFSFLVQVWEMETGQFVYQVTDAHGPSTEITAITVDSSGYRLATGAYNG